MRVHRSGFTVIELLVVMAILGALAVIALPKAGRVFEGIGLRSAKHVVSAHLANARAAAIQNGATATFQRTGNEIRVVLDVPGSPTRVLMPYTNLQDKYGVTVDGVEEIRYNARGFAGGLENARGVIRLERGERADSVCIMGFGKVMASGCTL